MSGVLHPVGPEPASTYWLRRALVIGTLAVVVTLVTALLGGRNGPQQAVSAEPATSTPAETVATSTSPTPAPLTPLPSASPPSATSSAAAKKTTAPPNSTAPRKTTAAKPSEAKKPTTQTSKAAEKKQKPAPLCDPDVLRPTLTGKDQLEPKEDATFTLSMINGGATTCAVSVNAENFELKIYSGKDRIWTTGDCSTAVRSLVKEVPSQQAVAWKMTWNGRRSAQGCKNRAEIPEPGTYVATATLEGTKPVRFRMTLAD